jgi:hypothetical protein
MKTAILLSILLSVAAVACAPAAPDKEAPSETETPPAPAKEATPPPDWPMQDGRYVLNWPDLAIPDYRTEFNEEIQQEVSIPLFRDEVKRLHGELVLIEGFFIPFESEESDETFYILSQYPNSQCFFCGGAGPDTVMDLMMKSPPGHLKMDDRVTFKGRLRVNDSDVMYLNYILDDAELVK